MKRSSEKRHWDEFWSSSPETADVYANDGRLVGVYTIKDFKYYQQYPQASLDSKGRLLVGAAIGVQDGDIDRALAMVQGGTLSEVAKRHLAGVTGPTPVDPAGDVALAQQHVSVRFPKSRIAIMSWEGTEYSIFSSRLVLEAGRGQPGRRSLNNASIRTSSSGGASAARP